jgi:polyisoprenyl-phosphate glycosyltransferase
MPRPEVSLVIPIYNEEEVLPRLDERLQELLAKIDTTTEVVFVDDGSKDKSLELLRALVDREPRYRAVSFARNFGHQRAITCGMDSARGKAIVVMDADLQDPPEVILQMIAKWREGYDVVYGKRRSRQGESWFKLFTAKIFYRLFAAMIPIEVPLDAGDFRLMSRRVVVAMRELSETHRFVRGLVSWVGFKQTAVEYDRAARFAGETKYPLKKMLAFAFDGIMSFSVLPLRLTTYLGALVGAASVLYGVSALFSHFVLHNTVPGWTTTVVLVSVLFSVQLLVTGVLGEYVGRIYEQVKQRPLYIVGERVRHKPMRRRAQTRDFVSSGEALRTTDRPVAPVPPPAEVPSPFVSPPPSPSAPSSSPKLITKAPPPLPSATKQRDKA